MALTAWATATLFPLALTPEMSRLRDVAPGVLWVAALLSSLLALEHLFREDAQDRSLEQFALSGQPFTALLLAKTVAHWLLTGLPLALMAPFVAVAYGVTLDAMPGIWLALVLGTIFIGVATPTEGGAMGATGALAVDTAARVVDGIARELKWLRQQSNKGGEVTGHQAGIWKI